MDPRLINLLPAKSNQHILKLISQMGIVATPIYVDIKPEFDAENGSCFLNVKRKIDKSGGRAVLGWQFCEYPYMIEGEFHAVWESPEGSLIDITPGNFEEINQILFVVDRSRNYDGIAIDNVRLNTTMNELVDDIIEIEKAKFELNNYFYDCNGVIKNDISYESKSYWILINQFSDSLDELLLFNGTLESPCFCNSGLKYESCHRFELYELMNKIRNIPW